MTFFAATDKGRARKQNEDGYLVSQYVFAVADGMGGHVSGEIASALALETLKKIFFKSYPREELPAAIKSAYREANAVIFKKASENADYAGMGTTLTIAVPSDDEFFVGNIGDSRVYLYRGGNFSQITEDHSLVAQMLRAGKLSEHEAEFHPLKSIITRALGTEPSVKADLSVVKIKPRDRLLLCTDGLTGMVRDVEIAEVLASQYGLKETCQRLIAKANARGGLDNITVVLIEV